MKIPYIHRPYGICNTFWTSSIAPYIINIVSYCKHYVSLCWIQKGLKCMCVIIPIVYILFVLLCSVSDMFISSCKYNTISTYDSNQQTVAILLKLKAFFVHDCRKWMPVISLFCMRSRHLSATNATSWPLPNSAKSAVLGYAPGLWLSLLNVWRSRCSYGIVAIARQRRPGRSTNSIGAITW